MKKIALTSLIAMFAFAGAHAANVIDGNPLYMPKKGHAYSVTTLGSHSGSEEIKSWGAEEEFGYGITDKLAVTVDTTVTDERSFDQWAWDDMSFGLTFRALEKGAWKLDLVGGYGVGPVWDNHRPFLDKDDTGYAWTVGVRGGYAASNWTVAGHALFNYLNTESFNWNDDGMHVWQLGVDAQYVMCPHMNVVAGVEYTGLTDSWAKNAGSWDATLGLNFNIDTTKYVGVYVGAEMDHQGGANNDEWDVQNGFNFGAKFGIDF